MNHLEIKSKILKKDFFNRNCIEVAKDLLGKILVWGDFKGIITEVEGYRGLDDPASHAFKGPTPRSKIMFGPPGRTYVYLIYVFITALILLLSLKVSLVQYS